MSRKFPELKPPRTAEELRETAAKLERDKKKKGIHCRDLEH